MKILIFFIFSILHFNLCADTFESYGFDKSAGNTDVLIGIKDNKIIFEKYSNNFNFNHPHILYSLNKLFLNAFIGNLEQAELLSVSKPIQNSINDTFTSKLTIDSLMRMNSGLTTIADPDTMEKILPGLLRPITEMPESLFDYYLLKSLPMHAPNTNYNYSFYDNNLLIQHLEVRFGRTVLPAMLSDFLIKNNFHETKAIVNPSDSYLFDDYNSFLNKILLRNNPLDMFFLPKSRLTVFSSPKDILEMAKLFLHNKNNIFTEKWKNETFSSDPRNFVRSRTMNSFFARFTYGRFWVLNTPHTDGTKAFPLLPDDMAVIPGLNGQMLAIFPSQNAIYLRLATDERYDRFKRGKHLKQFYYEFLK